MQYLGTGIHGMEYRIEDRLGFHDMERVVIHIWLEEDKKINIITSDKKNRRVQVINFA